MFPDLRTASQPGPTQEVRRRFTQDDARSEQAADLPAIPAASATPRLVLLNRLLAEAFCAIPGDDFKRGEVVFNSFDRLTEKLFAEHAEAIEKALKEVSFEVFS